jgi:hypothetical protein
VDTALLQCSGMAERHAAMIMTERVDGGGAHHVRRR